MGGFSFFSLQQGKEIMKASVRPSTIQRTIANSQKEQLTGSGWSQHNNGATHKHRLQSTTVTQQPRIHDNRARARATVKVVHAYTYTTIQ
jgi:hypothetical protein